MAILPIDGKRYGTPEMTSIFEEQSRIDYQLRIEGAAAHVQAGIGMIPKEAGLDIRRTAGSGKVTAARVKKLEAKSDHDTAALVQALSERCRPASRPWVHFGLTSNDLVDTANSLQFRDALKIIMPKIARMGLMLSDMAERYAGLPAVGRTHGQHASIISFGLKFANWAEEMARHLERLHQIKPRVLVCKTLGVVGTGSLMGSDAVRVQAGIAGLLGLYPAVVATQTVPRERYVEYVGGLALVGSTLEKVSTEVRNLQRTEIGEVAEFFKKGQMGSSAVPVKRNPIKSERVSSLARIVRAQVMPAFENVPLWHERDLSNSANERFILPTTPIILDEMLGTVQNVLENLTINKKRIGANLSATGGQIFAEFVLKALIKRGVPRFDAYRSVQRVAFEAAAENQNYMDAITRDKSMSVLSDSDIRHIFTPENHLGSSKTIISNVKKSVRAAVKRYS